MIARHVTVDPEQAEENRYFRHIRGNKMKPSEEEVSPFTFFLASDGFSNKKVIVTKNVDDIPE